MLRGDLGLGRESSLHGRNGALYGADLREQLRIGAHGVGRVVPDNGVGEEAQCDGVEGGVGH